MATFAAAAATALMGGLCSSASAQQAARPSAAPAALAARNAPGEFREATHGAGSLRYVQGIPVLIVAGTPEEIGEQTGRLVGEPGRAMQEMPKRVLQAHGLGSLWPAAARLGRQLIGRAPEEYRREIEAGLGVTGLDADSVYVGNALIELRRLGGCSAFIIEPSRSTSGRMLFGRNLDFETFGFLHKYSLLTICRPQDKLAFAAVGFPGLSGVLSGMNEAGLALGTLDVGAARDGSPVFDPGGSPMSLTFRRVLEECRTVDEAEKLLKATRHSTWMNLAICDGRQSAVFELTTRTVVRRDAQTGVLSCTNHFRSPQLAAGTSCGRYAALQRRGAAAKLSVSDVAAAMHEVNQGAWTLQTMIFEPESLQLHLAIGRGPVSAGPLTPLDLRPYLKPDEPAAASAGSRPTPSENRSSP